MEELLAVLLSAFLIFAPLYAGDTQSFLHGYPHTGGAAIQSTEVLAWLGFVVLLLQVLISFRQTGISREQNALIAGQNSIASQAYVASHRPKLIVRDVSLNRTNGPDGAPLNRFCIHYTLANVGGSKATIIAGGFMAHKWKSAFQPFSSDADVPHFPSKVFLHPGESVESLVPIEASVEELNQIMVSLELKRMNKPGVQDFDLIFRGGVVYVDDNGIKRRTSVWRTCKGAYGLRMKPIDDADYEYAD